jgi:hypothetical protein
MVDQVHNQVARTTTDIFASRSLEKIGLDAKDSEVKKSFWNILGIVSDAETAELKKRSEEARATFLSARIKADALNVMYPPSDFDTEVNEGNISIPWIEVKKGAGTGTGTATQTQVTNPGITPHLILDHNPIEHLRTKYFKKTTPRSTRTLRAKSVKKEEVKPVDAAVTPPADPTPPPASDAPPTEMKDDQTLEPPKEEKAEDAGEKKEEAFLEHHPNTYSYLRGILDILQARIIEINKTEEAIDRRFTQNFEPPSERELAQMKRDRIEVLRALLQLRVALTQTYLRHGHNPDAATYYAEANLDMAMEGLSDLSSFTINGASSDEENFVGDLGGLTYRRLQHVIRNGRPATLPEELMGAPDEAKEGTTFLKAFQVARIAAYNKWKKYWYIAVIGGVALVAYWKWDYIKDKFTPSTTNQPVNTAPVNPGEKKDSPSDPAPVEPPKPKDGDKPPDPPPPPK